MPYVQYGQTQSPTKRVFMTYTAAVSAGYPVCYDFDNVNTYQNESTAAIALTTGADSRRICVEKPSVFNNLHFAGVIAKDYPAGTSGQWIEIYPPGSICNIRLCSVIDAHMVVTGTNINTGELLTFEVDKWFFNKAGFAGKGSAEILQLASGPNLCMAELQTGEQSGGYQTLSVYSGTTADYSVLISGQALTRGGVTEIASAQWGTDETAVAATTTEYILTAGNYIGQKKLVLLTASAVFVAHELVINVTVGAQVATSIVHSAGHGKTADPSISIGESTLTFSTSKVENETVSKALFTWDGDAWLIQPNVDYMT